MSLILGIDPGANTGVATFVDGVLTRLDTIGPALIERTIREASPARVIFEDSRLQSHAWTAQAKTARGVALATARSLGQVDAWCRLITDVCEELGIPAHGISPAAKGPKRGAENFAVYTGWQASSNQHERDAAMVAWTFRRSQGVRHA